MREIVIVGWDKVFFIVIVVTIDTNKLNVSCRRKGHAYVPRAPPAQLCSAPSPLLLNFVATTIILCFNLFFHLHLFLSPFPSSSQTNHYLKKQKKNRMVSKIGYSLIPTNPNFTSAPFDISFFSFFF